VAGGIGRGPAEPGFNALAVDTIDWMVQRIVEHVVVDLDASRPMTSPTPSVREFARFAANIRSTRYRGWW